MSGKSIFKKVYFSNIILGLFISLFSFSAWANEPAAAEAAEHAPQQEEKFDAGKMILHHIADEHEWHFFTIGHFHATVPLPCIVYTESAGLQIFSSSNFKNEHHEEVPYQGLKLEHGKIHAENGETVYDISITKNVASLLLSAVLLLSIFIGIGKTYKENPHRAPKGIQSLFEPIIIFVRDEIAKNNIGEKHYRRFMPYLLTVFFFIWFNNMLGLIPGGANVTGNIAVTAVMAIIAFFVTNLNGKATYWTHVFAMPGVPKWMLFIMTPVEIVGVFMKPFSLMVRLFANMTAGHIILLSLVSLIFIFENAALGIAVVPFSLFMNVIELIVAFIQAFIFTMLVSTYIGAAIEEHHH
ncbi:F0F1 ATP synthase subunit A [Aquirufa aurantiipilula]|uniref:F0F1 ATP synthase subunit A n=1 Tax=Aquirufa aurantiipilula TaxID=2696561 RepID=UPI001CAA46A4|nr:F0F1 ATP synthase subunit A [Aquirufa aurantiipilula]MBZ1325972.1 F0F1 ATP synthase subunit A [Aquirufa aurantiipilula]